MFENLGTIDDEVDLFSKKSAKCSENFRKFRNFWINIKGLESLDYKYVRPKFGISQP